MNNIPALQDAPTALPAPRINSAAIELAAKARAWLGRAKELKITSIEHHAQAVEARKQIGIAKRQLDDIAKAHTAPYRGAIDAIRGFFRGPEENIAESIKLLDRAILDFEAAEQRRREAEAAELRKRQAEEAARLKAEQERQAAEQRAREAEALEAARALEEAGKVDAADALLEQAAEAATALEAARILQDAVVESVLHAPIETGPALATGGTQRRAYWSAKVVDQRALVEAWLAGTVPDQVITINESFLNGQARLLKDTLAYPGVAAIKATRVAG